MGRHYINYKDEGYFFSVDAMEKIKERTETSNTDKDDPIDEIGRDIGKTPELRHRTSKTCLSNVSKAE